MSTKRNEADGGGPDDSTVSDQECEGEDYDTLAPLPADLLIHPHEIDDANNHDNPIPHHHRSPVPPSNGPFSSSAPQRPGAARTTAASKRRSVEASSGRPIFPVRNPTKQDLEHARKILESLQTKHGFVAPDRGNLNDPSIMWKEGKPDYTITDLHYFLGKTKNHTLGSLEQSVENFIKTWEMEATHKEFYQWTTVDQDAYEVQANGGKIYSSEEAPWVGNYNWLLATCDKNLYDSTKETFESSHGKFRYAFPEGFPFEVLEVFSGPPKITFTWRHWAVFSGQFEGHKGNGETINMTGFGVVSVNEDGKAKKIEIYYDPDSFLEVLRGKKECSDGIDRGVAFGGPIAGGLDSLARMMTAIELEEKGPDGVGNNGGRPTTEQTTERDKGNGESNSRCPFSGVTR